MEETTKFKSLALIEITESEGEDKFYQSKEAIMDLMAGSDSERDENEVYF